MNFKIRPVLIILVLYSAAFAGEKHAVFSLPDSELLFSGAWNIEIVSPATSEVISVPDNPEGNKGPSAMPAISRDGTLIASGFPVANDPAKKWKVRIAVGVYSRSVKKWKTHGDFHQIHSISFSPDGTRLAIIADTGAASNSVRELLLLQLQNGVITKLATITAVSVSWSADGQKLAVGTPGGNVPPQIYILDLSSQKMHELVKGAGPAWSPRGDWIAYFDPSGQKIHVVHPDGTADHVVHQVSRRFFTRDTSFGLDPVWSPDETALLLNRYTGANLDSRDVVFLDLKTGKATRKLHNGHQVFGWVALTN